MKYEQVEYYGAELTIPSFLVPLFPVDLPAKKWPTFCGAGGGFWDRVVPDKIHGVRIAPACFIHDCDWAATPDTLLEFATANWRFLRNCLALVNASDLWAIPLLMAQIRCCWYFSAVSTMGLFCFLASDAIPLIEEDPFRHPVIRARLKRLAYADIGLADVIAQHGGYDDVE